MQKITNKIQLILIVVAIFILYWQVFVWMIGEWEHNPNYTHGYFVPLACLYLIFRRKDELKNTPKKPSFIGLFVIGAGVLMFMLGERIEFNQISLLALIVLIYGLIIAYWGMAVFKKLAFEIGYFIFAIPMPYYLESFTVPLKHMAAVASADILSFIGYTVTRNGNILYLPGYVLEVASACSGLKSLVLVTAVGAIYAYITQPTTFRKWLLFLLSIPIAVIANIARIVTVAVVATHLGEKVAFSLVHDTSGIFVFVVAGILLALTGWIIEWISKKLQAG